MFVREVGNVGKAVILSVNGKRPKKRVREKKSVSEPFQGSGCSSKFRGQLYSAVFSFQI